MRKTTLSFACLCLVVGCGTNGPTSGGGYEPEYTEPVGTVHEGDYFPLTAGIRSVMVANVTVATVTRTTMTAPGMNMDTTEYDTSTSIDTMETLTLGEVGITLSTGPATLYGYQVVTVDPSDGSTATETIYYEVASDGIYQIAEVMDVDGTVDTIEFGRALYLKTPLVVGDSWNVAAQPDVFMPGMGGSIHYDESSGSTYYVIGNETVTLANGQHVQALRIDAVSSGAYTMVVMDTPVSGTANGVSSMYLVKDTGDVAEVADVHSTSAIDLSQDGTTITIDISMDMDMESSLLSHTSGGLPKARTVEATGGAAPVLDLPQPAEFQFPAVFGRPLPHFRRHLDCGLR
jgi:hypothetical protein